ncbi:MAG: branched-chain amino acid transport system ATP-binding protein [Patescibacteria group bacterium]|nr:branched-chain amino acid transport system ATP-binding protein [Patescibacteria group bacterium]MDQ5968848.1 branched-chain amino acid transport system ATP-binding protein [Patescibacteria group bacterium]MDQ5971704.1 branched-chain amino acid transport system ATP-binding protein [Patescibacteria group bacterium]
MNILETKKITKHFDGVYAVDGLSVSFEKGKITGLIGPNGSGKSTLINLLTGVIQINAGSVVISSKEEVIKILPHEVSDYGITRTFQEVRLFEQMLVIDNILVVLTKRNVFSSLFETHKKFHLERAEEVLKKVDLWKKRNDLAKNLSYGQRKLLEVGRMLAMSNGFGDDSDIFFLDEPFAGLFPEMRKIVIGVIRHLKEQGKTVILVEHNIDIIRELCDHIIVLDNGKLLAGGIPSDVLSKREVMDAYLGE